MSTSKPNRATERIVYSEFGTPPASPALDRPAPPPAQQTLKVQTSRKGRKGKTVTLISGFAAKPETLAALTKKLKTLCGAGGTVKESEIEIQGDHRQQVAAFLGQQGYPVKLI